MANLDITSAHRCLDSMLGALDQYQRRYGHMPAWVMLAKTLPAAYAWLLGEWCTKNNIRVSLHQGETAWLLTEPVEEKR
jgi:hypothetical protein